MNRTQTGTLIGLIDTPVTHPNTETRRFRTRIGHRRSVKARQNTDARTRSPHGLRRSP